MTDTSQFTLVHKDNLKAMIEAMAFMLAAARREKPALSEGHEAELREVQAALAPYLTAEQRLEMGSVQVEQNSLPLVGYTIVDNNGLPPSWSSNFYQTPPPNAAKLVEMSDSTNPFSAPHKWVALSVASHPFRLSSIEDKEGMVRMAIHQLATQASTNTINIQGWDGEGKIRAIVSQESLDIPRDVHRILSILKYAALLPKEGESFTFPLGGGITAKLYKEAGN